MRNRSGTLDIEMIEIPGGEIELRDDRIDAKWTVNIEPFLLGKYPITKDIYSKVMGKMPAAYEENQHPVENVSWFDAANFCNWLSGEADLKNFYIPSDDGEEVISDYDSNGYRLPTEAEWEFACRAGSKEYRYGDLDSIAWYKGNSEGMTHEVGTKEPNIWGLYDMLGNVWEWCNDIYDEEVYGKYRIFRGGGWFDSDRSCGAPCRRRSHPSFYIDDLGFRIAKNMG